MTANMTVQNLVAIGAVILIVLHANLNILHVKLENACSRPKMGFLWDFTPKMGSSMNETPKGTSLGGNTSYDV